MISRSFWRFGLVRGAPLPVSLRLIRFARMTALVADIWTIFCAVFIAGWQMIIFLREGNWHALPLSSVFNTLKSDRDEIYSTASIGKIEWTHLNLLDALLQVPVIVPLLLVAALLTAFYLWLSNTEKRYSRFKITR